jgi:PAS domain-containing protein
MDKYIITSITDTDGKIRYVSKAFCDISGYTKEELIGRKHSMLKHPDMNQSIYKFKKYNDTYGHKMGDDALRSISKTMKEMLSLEGDVAFRLGGEEFGGIISAQSQDEAKESGRNRVVMVTL